MILLRLNLTKFAHRHSHHPCLSGEEYLADYFTRDTRSPSYLGKVGQEVGRAIQDTILWRKHNWIDRDRGLSQEPWTEKDLEPPGDTEELHLLLRHFWLGFKVGAQEAREHFATLVAKAEQSSK
jgi:hypothetical protein